MYARPLTVLIALAALAFAALPAEAAKNIKRDLSKNFDELTPSEQIAIRAAAKAAYKAKKIKSLTVCADPGNMPLSNDQGRGIPEQDGRGARRRHGRASDLFLAPLPRAGPDPADLRSGHVRRDVRHAGELRFATATTFPVYKTPYVLAYRSDKGLELTGLDDPKLKDLKIGVFQTSGLRAALAKRGVVNNVSLQVQSHDADLVPEHQPWWVVQKALNGEIDVAGVFGPFAGWLKTMKNEPLTIHAGQSSGRHRSSGIRARHRRAQE